jgi:hypothetical protein
MLCTGQGVEITFSALAVSTKLSNCLTTMVEQQQFALEALIPFRVFKFSPISVTIF